MKNKFLLILLLLLIASIAALIFFQKPAPPVNADLFRIPSPESIDKVILRSAHEKVELVFSNNKWRVNGREADLQRVKVFFAAWIQAEPRRKITGASADSLRVLEGVEAEFFQHDVRMKKFRATGDGEETYFVQDNNVYLASIPGYRVALYDIFAMSEAEWRKKRIFDFNWTKFKSLHAAFPDPKDDFSISFNGKYFGAAGMQADTAQLNNYLDAISLLQAVRFLKKNEVPAPGQPVVTLEVRDIRDSAYVLRVFPEEQNHLRLAQTGNDFLWLDAKSWNIARTNRNKLLRR